MADKSPEVQQQTEMKDAPPVEEVDQDAAELAAARAAMEAEEKAAAGEDDTKSEDGDEQKQETVDKEPPKESKSKPEAKKGKTVEADPGKDPDPRKPEGKATPMIPKERLDQTLSQIADLEVTNTLLKSKLESLERLIQQGDAKPKDVKRAAEDVVDAVEAKRKGLQQKVMAAAEDYDNQEISWTQYKKIEMEADSELAALDRESLLQDLVSKIPQSPQHRDDDVFASMLVETLAHQHPYTEMIPDGDMRWQFLTFEAASALKNELGRDIVDTPMDTLLLKQRVAELTDKYGPIWYPDAKVATSQGDAQQRTQQPRPSDNVRAREEKLKLAEKSPPNINELGSSGKHIEPTDDQISKMTDEEIEALPGPVRQKYLNLKT